MQVKIPDSIERLEKPCGKYVGPHRRSSTRRNETLHIKTIRRTVFITPTQALTAVNERRKQARMAKLQLTKNLTDRQTDRLSSTNKSNLAASGGQLFLRMPEGASLQVRETDQVSVPTCIHLFVKCGQDASATLPCNVLLKIVLSCMGIDFLENWE